MARQTIFWALLMSSALRPTNATAQTQPDSLLPTLALHQFHEELAAATDRSAQGDIAERILKLTQRGNLHDAERFALAELFFVALKPDPADSLFSLYLDGSDLRARMATQRKLRITMAAFTVYRGMEDSIRAARARFPVTPADPWHLQASVSTLARYHAERGEHATAVRLVMDEIATLPEDGLFFSHALPGAFLASFEHEGKRDVALAHIRRVRDALSAAGNSSARGEQPPAAQHVAGVVHRLEEGLLSDLDDAQRQRFLRGRLIGALSGYLAQAGG